MSYSINLKNEEWDFVLEELFQRRQNDFIPEDDNDKDCFNNLKISNKITDKIRSKVIKRNTQESEIKKLKKEIQELNDEVKELKKCFKEEQKEKIEYKKKYKKLKEWRKFVKKELFDPFDENPKELTDSSDED